MSTTPGLYWGMGAWIGTACFLYPSWVYLLLLPWFFYRSREQISWAAWLWVALSFGWAWWSSPLTTLSQPTLFTVQRAEEDSQSLAWGRCESEEGWAQACVRGLPSSKVGSQWKLSPVKPSSSRVHAELISASPPWRKQWKTAYDQWLGYSMPSSPQAAALYSAMATGDVEDASLRPLLARFGMSHILALSGLHVTLVLVTLTRLLSVWGLPHRALLLLQALLLGSYLILVGPYPSALRAGSMAALQLCAMGLGRPTPALQTLGITVAWMLLWDPQLAGHFGFQLSCAATYGLLVYTRPIARWLNARLVLNSRAHRWGRACGHLFAANLAVLPLTIPLLLLRFHEFNIMGIFVNALAAPLLSFGFACSLFVPIFGQWLGGPLGWCSELLLQALDLPWWCDGWTPPLTLSTTTAIGCTLLIGILLDRPMHMLRWYRLRIATLLSSGAVVSCTLCSGLRTSSP